jgi:ankyrin repeat protein
MSRCRVCGGLWCVCENLSYEFFLEKVVLPQSHSKPLCMLQLHSLQNSLVNLIQWMQLARNKRPPLKGLDGGVWSAYMISCDRGHLEVVKWLVCECGVDRYRRSTEGYTGLHCAVVSGHVNVVEWLVRYCEADMEFQTRSGYTSFALAAHHGRSEVFQCLFNEGAVRDTRCPEGSGYTALHQCIAPLNFTYQSLFIPRFMRGHYTNSYRHGNMSGSHRLTLVQWMIQVGGADMEDKNSDGDDALLLAASGPRNTRMLKWLLTHGADVNATNAGLGVAAGEGITLWEYLWGGEKQIRYSNNEFDLIKSMIVRAIPPVFVVEKMLKMHPVAGKMLQMLRFGSRVRQLMPVDSPWRAAREATLRASDCGLAMVQDTMSLVLGYAHVSEDELWDDLEVRNDNWICFILNRLYQDNTLSQRSVNRCITFVPTIAFTHKRKRSD